MTTAMEWRRCRQYPAYEVSECGDLRRGAARLKGHINGDGYLSYSITNDHHHRPVTAHYLVAVAFLEPPPGPGYEVAHENGSRIGSHFSNLRWATRKSNHADMQVHGTAPKGHRNGRAKLTAADITSLKSEYARIKLDRTGERISDLAKRFGIHHATLCHHVRGSIDFSDPPFHTPDAP